MATMASSTVLPMVEVEFFGEAVFRLAGMEVRGTKAECVMPESIGPELTGKVPPRRVDFRG